jgi:hypothetical protein
MGSFLGCLAHAAAGHAAEEGDELAADHSITSSASVSTAQSAGTPSGAR